MAAGAPGGCGFLQFEVRVLSCSSTSGNLQASFAFCTAPSISSLGSGCLSCTAIYIYILVIAHIVGSVQPLLMAKWTAYQSEIWNFGWLGQPAFVLAIIVCVFHAHVIVVVDFSSAVRSRFDTRVRTRIVRANLLPI